MDTTKNADEQPPIGIAKNERLAGPQLATCILIAAGLGALLIGLIIALTW